MKAEKQQLVRDLLADVQHDEATLSAAGQILRRRRRWRAVRRLVIMVLAMTAIVTLLVERNVSRTKSEASIAVATPTKAKVESPTRALTDNELLSLFPNTPVGLVTLPNGKKLLIFPRPEDEERYFTRI
jgi:hypothetical protein